MAIERVPVSIKLTQQWNGYAGIHAERTDMQGKLTAHNYHLRRTSHYFYPYLSLSYTPQKNHTLTTEVKVSYEDPSFQDLLPFLFATSQLIERVGNTDLKRSHQFRWILRYMFMKAAMVELTLSHKQNPIVDRIHVLPSGFQLQRINIDNSRYARLVLGLPIPVFKETSSTIGWTISTYGAIERTINKGLPEDAAALNTITSY